MIFDSAINMHNIPVKRASVLPLGTHSVLRRKALTVALVRLTHRFTSNIYCQRKVKKKKA